MNASGPRLATRRLHLRPFTRSDVDDLFATDGDARVMRYIGTGAGPRTRDEVVKALDRIVGYAADHPGLGLLHVGRREDGAFVGACGLFPLSDGSDIEIAYRLQHAAWGQGFATEAAHAVVEHGFAMLGLARIVGLTFDENAASQRVLRKIGFQDAGTAFHYEREMRFFIQTRERYDAALPAQEVVSGAAP